MQGFEMTDFMISLADKSNFKRFINQPESMMDEASLTEPQKEAVRRRDPYRIRRYTAMEMLGVSLHAQLLMRVFEESDPEFLAVSSNNEDTGIGFKVDGFPEVNTDTDTETVHNIVQMTDLGDEVVELSDGYQSSHYYDHLFFAQENIKNNNELVFVGTGINGANHLSAEAEAQIAAADIVLYCVADVVVERRVHQLANNFEDLYHFYGDGKLRRETYIGMVERIIQCLENYSRVCAVFYGHPGIFVWPSFKAIQIARKNGYRAYMLPAVSSLDCLFADVGFDPSRHSCQILEATDMLTRSRKPDLAASVIIFQVGCVGDLGFNSQGYDRRNLPILQEYLAEFYGNDHKVILYEASQYPVCPPKIKLIAISELVASKPTGIATLYIPQKTSPLVDQLMLERLGLSIPVNQID